MDKNEQYGAAVAIARDETSQSAYDKMNEICDDAGGRNLSREEAEQLRDLFVQVTFELPCPCGATVQFSGGQMTKGETAFCQCGMKFRMNE
jgi:hypothetical protein